MTKTYSKHFDEKSSSSPSHSKGNSHATQTLKPNSPASPHKKHKLKVVKSRNNAFKTMDSHLGKNSPSSRGQFSVAKDSLTPKTSDGHHL
jgi:hypothetical protein